MTFLELQNAVLSDRFDESKRADAKKWINYRYGRLWAAEDWTFKKAVVSYNVTSGTQTVALNTIQRPYAIWDSTTSPLYARDIAIRPEDFYDSASRTSSIPGGFTVIGTNIILENPVSSNRTLQVYGELKFVELSADGDTALIPSQFHTILVHGAASEGLKAENDPSWQGAEADFVAAYEDLKKGYLVEARTFGGAAPAWPVV